MIPVLEQQVLHPTKPNLVGVVVEIDEPLERARVRWPNSGYENSQYKRTWIAFKRLRPAPTT
jgi:hypothetical protein